MRGVGGAVATTAIVPQLGWLTGCSSETTSTLDWKGLAAQLDGRLLRAGDASFPENATADNLRYADVQPQGVALCSNASDVSTCLRWAARNSVPIAVRSGGHSYAGYSSGPGLIIHVGGMSAVAVDDAAMTVTALPGARNTTIYDALQPHGVAISAGRCPTVAIGGLVLGGGIGFSSRKLGLTCDHLVEAQVVLASGDVVTCNDRADPDLFWALRGAGGGNFGVATSYTFSTNAVDNVAIYDVAWDWNDAATVFAAFQDVIASAPDDLSGRLGVGASGRPGSNKNPTISALGQFFGTADELRSLLAPALAAGRLTSSLIEERTFWAAKDYLLHTVPSQAYAVKSTFLDGPLSSEGTDVLLRAVEAWPGSGNDDGAGAAIFACGGAINRVAPDATAFAHRNKFAILATETTWTPADDADTVTQGLTWLDDLATNLRPYASASAYVNFIDRSQPDARNAYYGSNLARLSEIKKLYDPQNLFRFDQGVPPAN